jgi:hypothetical protein
MEIWRREEHGKRHYRETISKIQTEKSFFNNNNKKTKKKSKEKGEGEGSHQFSPYDHSIDLAPQSCHSVFDIDKVDFRCEWICSGFFILFYQPISVYLLIPPYLNYDKFTIVSTKW